jgi:hypothetical protein
MKTLMMHIDLAKITEGLCGEDGMWEVCVWAEIRQFTYEILIVHGKK